VSRWLPLAMALCCWPAGLPAYPLDGNDAGISRLAGHRLAQARAAGSKLSPGALLGIADIRLHLLQRAQWELDTAPQDAGMKAALEKMFADRDSSYGIALVDFTDEENIRWAGLNEDRAQAPGSVGKILCMLALFDGLRRAFPEVGARARILRERVVQAGDWVIKDAHKVPRIDTETGELRFAAIQPGESFTLAEWLDHMVSASANSAGSTIWKEAMLLREFGNRYPPSPEQEADYFRETPRQSLGSLAQSIINDALQAAALNPAALRVGSFWTRTGKQKVPGPGGSTATPRELARFMLRLEQGRLVDAWSSLEMKRYLYLTKRRYRYVFPPELAQAAVYFKSGSLYRCRKEEGFSCGKYMGNVENAMNSVVIVESPAQPGGQQRRYLVALTSNVLRKNSAWDHSRIGAAVEELVRSGHAVQVREAGSAADIKASGISD